MDVLPEFARPIMRTRALILVLRGGVLHDWNFCFPCLKAEQESVVGLHRINR